MTARQIISEIEALPVEEQEEVISYFKGRESDAPSVRYLDKETARPMIKQILAEHSELFRFLKSLA